MTLKYRELSDSAKERARQHYIEHWIHDDWYDYIYEEAIENGKPLGLNINNIFFTGFWSQGDGASWEGSVSLIPLIKEALGDTIGASCWLWLIEDGWINDEVVIFQQSNHYSHSGTMSAGYVETYDYSCGEDGDAIDLIKVDCILKGSPVQTLYDLIYADNECPIKDVDDLQELALTTAREYADEIYSTLREGYEGECDDHNIADAYDANEVLFNEEGEIV